MRHVQCGCTGGGHAHAVSQPGWNGAWPAGICGPPCQAAEDPQLFDRRGGLPAWTTPSSATWPAQTCCLPKLVTCPCTGKREGWKRKRGPQQTERKCRVCVAGMFECRGLFFSAEWKMHGSPSFKPSSSGKMKLMDAIKAESPAY